MRRRQKTERCSVPVARRMAVIVGALALLVHAAAIDTVQADPSDATNVAVSQVIEQQTAAGHTFVGTVKPLRTSTVGSAVDGRVLEFMVREGDRVEHDQPLCQVRTRTFDIQLAAAKAELASRQQYLAELKNGTRPEELAQAKARTLGAQAMKDYTRSRADRLVQLMERRATSQEVLDESLSAAAKAEQDYLEAAAALEMAQVGPRIEQIAQAEAQLQFQQEEVFRLEDIIERHRVTAPFSGYIVKEHTEIGQWVKAGDPIVDIVELDTVDIEALVLEDYVQQIRPGVQARVEIGAIPDDAFTGEVAVIVAQADLRSRTFPVRVRVKNEIDGTMPTLKSGMFARVTLPVGQPELATLVPKDAIVLGGPTPLVFCTDGSGATRTVRSVAVQLGVASGGLIQVKGELEAGQTVVVEGNERLVAGQMVTVVRELSPSDLQEQITKSSPAKPQSTSTVGTVTDERSVNPPVQSQASGL